ncbi:acyl-CoA dehydrogenase [Sphingomonas histidinilytica]|uniref:Acyl-CoA dehydrogenase n=1 Tax=Rhizorhabdus histidinilytica TaxID=439228 RepID=A0A1T5GTN6_9SPHN|nr:acyl-CoA dehydrogenase family protein [Rhizorhabdus histidinilytica]MBO9378925.1 acyl-CoA dehydrogenase [Rhizorhabdus histidinilytica]SKC11729.1 acyl-CoA dehydrogenase [Rhizorhabdus histidinilytica]
MPVLDLQPPGFMDSDELRLFAESARRFLADHADTAETRRWRDQGHVSPEAWRKAGEAGLLGLSIPAEYGGAGADFRFEVVLMEQLGLQHALNFAIPLHNAVVAPYIVSFGTEAQKRRWLPRAASGEAILAIAMTEPGAGSDLQAMKTTAVRRGDDYVLNGQKTFISNGAHASLIIVAAKTDRDAGGRGISLFLVDTRDRPGFSRGRLLDKLGQEGRDTAELFFEDMVVPEDCLLGGIEGRGFAMMMEKLPQERLVIAWQAMAMMECALEMTVAYVRERQAFGRAVIDFQNSQFKLAEAKTSATVAKVFLHHCTERLIEGGLDPATASMAKYWTTEAQARLIDECLQLFGGYGYMLEYPIAEMYKDARGYRIYGGTSEIMKLLIARTLV